MAHSADEAAEIASQILGMTLITPQTGPQGRVVRRLLIEEGLDIKRELYLGLLVDRESGRPVFMASSAGGMEIEEVAKDNPSAILREPIHPAVGLQPFQARKIAFGLGLSGEMAAVATPLPSIIRRRCRRLREQTIHLLDQQEDGERHDEEVDDRIDKHAKVECRGARVLCIGQVSAMLAV